MPALWRHSVSLGERETPTRESSQLTKNGRNRPRPHFHHQGAPGRSCEKGESPNHYYAKTIIAQEPHRFRFVRKCHDCSTQILALEPLQTNSVGKNEVKLIVESTQRKRTIDAVITISETAYAIEVWKSHEIGQDKRFELERYYGADRVFEVKANQVLDVMNGSSKTNELEDCNHEKR